MPMESEKSKPEEERLPLTRNIDGETAYKQTRVDTSIRNASKDAYLKMFTSAYEVALQPSMPLIHFKTVIKCQRLNGVKLIKGNDDHRSAAIYLQYIADAVREAVAESLGGSKFLSILSDGSQARKVKSEKELILTRTEKNGLPVYFVTSLLEMSRYKFIRKSFKLIF